MVHTGGVDDLGAEGVGKDKCEAGLDLRVAYVVEPIISRSRWRRSKCCHLCIGADVIVLGGL